MRAYYVTATGTDTGKTYVAAGLLKAWRAYGRDVLATKPVMTGFAEADLDISDCGRLLEAGGRPCSSKMVSEMCLHRLSPPVAPNIAMRRAGIDQDHDRILRFVQNRLRIESEIHLVEGAGGVMSPLTDTSLQLDLICQLGLPVLLVACPYLGAISHTLSAIDALASSRIAIAALVVSETLAGGADPEEFAAEIRRFRDLPYACIRHGGTGESLAAELVP